MRASFYALAGSAASALAATRGFNYGAQGQTLETFTDQFTAASALTEYSSARLYTMIQDGTANTVISAIPAAIKTNTTLLLGLWASEDQAAFNNELTALKNAISQFGPQGLADLTVGISVGSEDLYRISETGIKQKSGYGQSPDVLVDYIKQTREALAGTALANVPVGHVDTWNVYVNTSNAAVIEASDFLGLDEYPFYQDGEGNSIENAADLFWKAYGKVEAVSSGKPIWITETGWPISGEKEDEAVPSIENAASFWQQIACELEARCINFWWYILNDQGASPSFSVAGTLEGENTKPLFNLKCKNASKCGATVSSASSSAGSSATSMPKTGSKVGGASNGTDSDSYKVEPTVYVTEVTTQYTTTCPVGYVMTSAGKETTLTAPSVMTTSGVVSSTVSTSVTLQPSTVVNAGQTSVAWAPVTGGAAMSSGVAMPSGTGSAGLPNGGASGSTLASSWAANQTPGASKTVSAKPSSYTGSAAKVGGSLAVVLGAAAAALL